MHFNIYPKKHRWVTKILSQTLEAFVSGDAVVKATEKVWYRELDSAHPKASTRSSSPLHPQTFHVPSEP